MNNNPTKYHDETHAALRLLLEDLIRSGKRVRLFYGYTDGPKAGQDWHEEHGVSGTLGRSTGTQSIPLLIARLPSVMRRYFDSMAQLFGGEVRSLPVTCPYSRPFSICVFTLYIHLSVYNVSTEGITL